MINPLSHTNRAVSISLAVITSTALITTLIVLTHLEYLPRFTYYITAGSATASLLVPFVIASCCRKPSNQADEISSSSKSNPDRVDNAQEIPPIMDILDKETYITLNPYAKQSLPPSDRCAFITTQFNFTVAADGQSFCYDLPVYEFYKDNEGNLLAVFIYNDERYAFICNEVKDQDSASPVLGHQASLDELNKKIQLPGYLSKYEAFERLGRHIMPRRNGLYFCTEITDTQATFEIPGLLTYKLEKFDVTFFRDTSQPLIHSDQINHLIGLPSDDWGQWVGVQLNQSSWPYKSSKIIRQTVQDGNRVTLFFE